MQYIDSIKSLRANIKYVPIFKNRGKTVGASAMTSESQIDISEIKC